MVAAPGRSEGGGVANLQGAAADRRPARVGVRAGQNQRPAARLRQGDGAARVLDDSRERAAGAPLPAVRV